MDAVYILGSGSLSNDDEIRYSIRSLELNMLDLRNIYVIGEKPEFLQKIIHIPATDGSKYNHENAYKKICLACKIPELSDEFLLMNDDFFMSEPFTGADFPFFALKNSNGGPCGKNSFHMHCPIRLKKEWYLKMPIDPLFKSCKSPRTFYANFYQAPPTFCDDFILRAGKGCKDFDEQIKGRTFFSIGDQSMLYPPFKIWLDKLFPVPSTFENLEK